jgi:hypothetical protein
VQPFATEGGERRVGGFEVLLGMASSKGLRTGYTCGAGDAAERYRHAATRGPFVLVADTPPAKGMRRLSSPPVFALVTVTTALGMPNRRR